MTIRFFTAVDQLPADFGPSAVTFGKFDGVHLGHLAVIEALERAASERGLVSTVLTFDRNPLALLDPGRTPENVTSSRQRRELLDRAGVDALVELPFDRDFSSQTAEEFVTRVLVGALQAEVVLVGPGTRFGAGGSGHFDTLVEMSRVHGFEVRQLDAFADRSSRVSSTRIRRLLADGDVSAAAALLGRNPSVRAIVVHGQKRGRALGYPTANLSPDLEGLIPADGVYAGYLTPVGADAVRRGERMAAAISIGNNPTFDGVPERQVEAYVLDEDFDIYDVEVEVEFAERVRGMMKFDSLDGLIERMGLDTARVREITA